MNIKSLYFFLGSLLIILILTNLKIGYIHLSYQEIFGLSDTQYRHIINIRWNKILSIILGGISIAISGFLLQEMLKNPLAGPSVLGISSSAGLGVALALFSGLFSLFPNMDIWLYPIFGMLGASITLAVLLIYYQKFNSQNSFIIFGFLISGLTGAITSLLQFYAPSENIKQYLMWSLGSFNYLSLSQNLVFLSLTLIGLLLSSFAVHQLKGNLLGEKYAGSLGVNIKKMHQTIVVATVVLTGTTTSFLGPIVFMGIVIPHFSRALYNPSKLWGQFILNILIGSIFLLMINIFIELFNFPLNVLISLISIPIIIYMLIKKNNWVDG